MHWYRRTSRIPLGYLRGLGNHPLTIYKSVPTLGEQERSMILVRPDYTVFLLLYMHTITITEGSHMCGHMD